jgi:hypothetical protein
LTKNYSAKSSFGILSGSGVSYSRNSSSSSIFGIAKLNFLGICVGAEGIRFIGEALGDKKS